MRIIKVFRDYVIKSVLGKSVVPSGLVELYKYFRQYGPIVFESHKEEYGIIVSVSKNFRFGTIIAHGKNPQELDAHIKDAILTSFEIPSSYKKEAAIIKEGERGNVYALA